MEHFCSVCAIKAIIIRPIGSFKSVTINFIYIAHLETEFTKCFDKQSMGYSVIKE